MKLGLIYVCVYLHCKSREFVQYYKSNLTRVTTAQGAEIIDLS